MAKEFSLVISIVAALSVTALAGPLDGDGNAYNDGVTTWTGSTVISSDGLTVAVDYCVYAPGAFPYAGAGYDGWTPTPGEMVYAYQADSTGTLGLGQLAVLLLNPAGNIGAFDLGDAGVVPSNKAIDGSANWQWSPELVSDHSSGLVYCSIKKPEWGMGSVIDSEFGWGYVPSPGPDDIPEPATMTLLALGGLAAAVWRKKRAGR